MDSFFLPFEIKPPVFNIKHGDHLLFLGSCFSNEISNKAAFYGFDVKADPFGTIFHPEVIARNLADVIDQENIKERIIERDDLFFSWDASGTLFSYNQEDLDLKLKQTRKELLSSLLSAKVLFITFGTAWGYSLKENSLTVANCHKVPNTSFEKQLASIDSLEQTWTDTINKLKAFNKDVELVFTVSPVRHTKDGVVENNQSKAILIELVRRLTVNQGVSYFPSYEIMMDELRDYRFYKKDRVHPNEEAVEYIWEKFKGTYLNEETINICSKVGKIQQANQHRSLYSESKEYLKFQEKNKRNLEELLKEFPNIKLK